jgi:predicted  nucleic acid-binding Zn-ribbon protein
MSIEATTLQIASLLRLAELDAQATDLSSEAFRARREASLRRVASPLLDRYQALLDVGRAPVVAAIERGSCSGCHVRLPTMMESQARRSPAIHTCPHCRRMLYAPELLAQAGSPRERKPAKKEAPRRRAPRAAAAKAPHPG